jgi:hypothetical protein
MIEHEHHVRLQSIELESLSHRCATTNWRLTCRIIQLVGRGIRFSTDSAGICAFGQPGKIGERIASRSVNWTFGLMVVKRRSQWAPLWNTRAIWTVPLV